MRTPSGHTSLTARHACGSVCRGRRVALLMGCLLLLAGCRVERPKEILSPEQMENVLYDFHLAQIMGAELNMADAYKRPLYMEYVYDKHHITSAQLDSSLVWYARYPKNLATIYDHLAARADAEIERVRQMQLEAENRGPKPVEGDSADIWYDHRLVMLSTSPLSNRVSYTIPTDTNFHLCDVLEWTFDVHFFPRNTDWQQVFDGLQAAIADSLICDSLTIDSLCCDSLCCDSLTTDSLCCDSLCCDSLTADTLPATDGKQPRRRAKAVASLVLHYDNDSTIAIDKVLTDDASVRLTLQNTDSVRLSSVYVSVYFKSHASADRVILYNNSLTRYHYVAPPKPEVSDSMPANSADSLGHDSLADGSTIGTHAATADTLPSLTPVVDGEE